MRCASCNHSEVRHVYRQTRGCIEEGCKCSTFVPEKVSRELAPELTKAVTISARSYLSGLDENGDAA